MRMDFGDSIRAVYVHIEDRVVLIEPVQPTVLYSSYMEDMFKTVDGIPVLFISLKDYYYMAEHAVVDEDEYNEEDIADIEKVTQYFIDEAQSKLDQSLN